MKTADVMSTNVIAVGPDRPVREIAQLMSEHHFSGIPVVDAAGSLIGIVSHSDLLHRPETGTERKHRRWLDFFADPDTQAREYVKTHGMKASDVMSRNVITVPAETELRDAADILDRRNVKRLPVLRDGRLVGILTRGDIVRAFAQQVPRRAIASGSDAALQQAIEKLLAEQNWLDFSLGSVLVHDGVAEISGIMRSASQSAAVVTMAEEVVGAAKVDNKLRVLHPMGTGV